MIGIMYCNMDKVIKQCLKEKSSTQWQAYSTVSLTYFVLSNTTNSQMQKLYKPTNIPKIQINMIMKKHCLVFNFDLNGNTITKALSKLMTVSVKILTVTLRLLEKGPSLQSHEGHIHFCKIAALNLFILKYFVIYNKKKT